MSDRIRQGGAVTTAAVNEHSVRAVIAELRGILAAGGIHDPEAEARDLVAALLDQPRFWPVLNADLPLGSSQCTRLFEAARSRAGGMPFAYAAGRAAFRHLTLKVDERVLIPRQETEQLVQAVLDAMRGRSGGTVADVGTGSGAIALALATEGRFDRVIATDVSLGALNVARENVDSMRERLRCDVELRHGSLLAPLHDVRACAIVSNPPYIASHEAKALPRSVRDWEPPVALFSAGDGMADSLALISGAAELLEPGGLLALELDARRAPLAAEAAGADGRYTDIAIRLDLAGRERILLATRT